MGRKDLINKSRKTSQQRESEGRAVLVEGPRDIYADREFSRALRLCVDK